MRSLPSRSAATRSSSSQPSSPSHLCTAENALSAVWPRKVFPHEMDCGSCRSFTWTTPHQAVMFCFVHDHRAGNSLH